MKKQNYLFLICIFLLFGCEKFLDVKSDARLVVPQTLEDAQAILDDVLRMNEQTTPARGNDVIDDFYIPETIFNGLTETRRKFYKWDYEEYRGTGNDWSAAYIPVFNANLALELVNNINRSVRNAEQWDNVKGSALFYRAFYFFKLLVVFSPAYDESTAHTDHGIALRLDTDFNKLSSRASVKDCYNQILQDLTNSLEYLPDYPQHVYRPSKVAAYALLSNIHHYMRDYRLSLEYANKALSYQNDLIDFNGDNDLLKINPNTTSPAFVKFNKETIFYTELYNALITYSPTSFRVDTMLMESFERSDLRVLVLFQNLQNKYIFKGNLTGSYSRHFGGLSTSELILNKAESQAILGLPEEAIRTLNILIEKRHVTGTPLFNPLEFNRDKALKIVRDERRKELLFRGIRFADIKRYNKEGANITLIRRVGGEDFKLEPNSKKYALPIPQDIIEITGMPQN